VKPPDIREFGGKQLLGLCRRMSIADDQTSELWRAFRQKEPQISDGVGTESYSVRIYGAEYSFSEFDPNAAFDKWAAAEASGPKNGGIEKLEIRPGLYAVFIHNGPASGAAATFGYIFTSWLPTSKFDLDLRPHFEILPGGYDPFDLNAKEEIWVPVRRR
jgi:AraC family transcriptional regulator